LNDEYQLENHDLRGKLKLQDFRIVNRCPILKNRRWLKVTYGSKPKPPYKKLEYLPVIPFGSRFIT